MAIVLILFCDASHEAITINAPRKSQPKLQSIEESIVYKALTVIEGDILVDKFCECQSERLCRLQNRNIIILTQLVGSKLNELLISNEPIAFQKSMWRQCCSLL